MFLSGEKKNANVACTVFKLTICNCNSIVLNKSLREICVDIILLTGCVDASRRNILWAGTDQLRARQLKTVHFSTLMKWIRLNILTDCLAFFCPFGLMYNPTFEHLIVTVKVPKCQSEIPHPWESSLLGKEWQKHIMSLITGRNSEIKYARQHFT